MPSLKKNFLYNGFITVFNMLFPLITFPYVSRVLGPESLGRASLALTIASYFAMVASLGLPTYATREIARNKHNDLSVTFSELLFINAGGVAAALACFSVFLFVSPLARGDLPLYAVHILFVLFSAFSIDWFFQGVENYKFIALRSTVIKVFSFAAMLFFVRTSADYVLYAFINIIAMSLNNVFNLWYARKFAKFSWNNLNIRRHLRKLPVFLVITAVSTVYTGLDKTLLGLACGNEALGLYTPAERIVRLVILGIVSLSAVFVPRLADLFATNTAEFWRLAKKSFNFLALLAVPAFVCLLVFAPFVIEVLAGDKYAGSVPLLRILSVVVLLVVGANVFGIQMLVLMGSEKKYLFSVVVSMVFGATVFYLAVPRLGGTGTSIGVVVAESVGLAIQLWFCRASLGRLFDPRFLCKVAAAVALSLVPSLVIMALAGSGKGLWGVAEVGVFWLSFGALLFAFKFEQVAFVKGFFQKREER